METVSIRRPMPGTWAADLAAQGITIALRPIHALITAPSLLFLIALTAMLLRHPDVAFYEVDRVAFGLLVLGVVARAVVMHQPLFVMERATWPMLGLTILAVVSVIGQPFDSQTWCVLAAKFVVPYTLFHLARLVFANEKALRQFEVYALAVLAYLSFTAIAFLMGAKALIFPHFILDESLGYHADRARGPLLQAVANGVSLNMLGLLALHAFRRGRFRGLKAVVLLGSVPIAILATMTRAVWLSFAGTLLVLRVGKCKAGARSACTGVAVIGGAVLLIMLTSSGLRAVLTDRLEERSPVAFRQAVYTGSWAMFLERPLTGWGVNEMPAQLSRHVSDYRERVLYPHNTYLELLVEHGVIGLALYVWLMWEMLRLSHGRIPREDDEHHGFLDRHFHAMWPVLLGVYWVNAAFVAMNYQFVNALLFTMAGMLAAQNRRAEAADEFRH